MSTKFRSGGDVFGDLGFSEEQSKDLRLRSRLMTELKKQIKARGESQARIAELLNVNQPRVSNLLKGRIDLFSLGSLVEMLDRLGNRVDLTVSPVTEEPICLTVNTAPPSGWVDQLSASLNAQEEPFAAFVEEHGGRRRKPAADNQYALAA